MTSSARPILNRRLAEFGTTIFAEMSALAVKTGAINLGQGFPDTDGPAEVAEAAVRAIREGRGNQYPPGPGIPELREAVAAHQHRFHGIDLDPATEVLVTAGATEAIAATLLALVEPGDEVVVFEPYYDSYAAGIALAGGHRVLLTLRAPGFRADLEELVDDAVAKGARVLTGGKRPEDRPAGWFYEPTVLADITPQMRVHREETFGPVATLYRFADLEEGIRLANDTSFGLSSNVWTRDAAEKERCVRDIETGGVFFNGMTASHPALPFGGVKRSGYGRELAGHGIKEFCNVTTVWEGPED